jgi:DNA-directed RNA polymerase subunit K/omega
LEESEVPLLRSSGITNKYELIIVASKEARRLNELSRQTGLDLGGKVTNIALEETKLGHVVFRYGLDPDDVVPAPQPEPEE